VTYLISSESLRWRAAAHTFYVGPESRLETLMAHGPRKIAALFAGIAVIALAAGIAPASAAPLTAPGLASAGPLVVPAQVFKRGRPPIYPYYYVPPARPGGWSFYFGPVPYAKGDFETQALQRVYPQLNYPPSMRYWTPQSGF
jgi:hypothetical protein